MKLIISRIEPSHPDYLSKYFEIKDIQNDEGHSLDPVISRFFNCIGFKVYPDFLKSVVVKGVVSERIWYATERRGYVNIGHKSLRFLMPYIMGSDIYWAKNVSLTTNCIFFDDDFIHIESADFLKICLSLCKTALAVAQELGLTKNGLLPDLWEDWITGFIPLLELESRIAAGEAKLICGNKEWGDITTKINWKQWFGQYQK